VWVDWKTTDQTTAQEKRQDRTNDAVEARRYRSSGPVVFPAPLFGPSFSTAVFSIAPKDVWSLYCRN